MTMLKRLRGHFLVHPSARDLKLDTPSAVSVHKQIIEQKPFLKKIYADWYSAVVAELPPRHYGPVIEIGSGAGFLRQFIPNLVTSEVVDIDDVDIRLDGRHLPFRKFSLAAIVLIDVLHHLPQPDSFFYDAGECVRPGGVVVMVEPWHTPWSRLIYTFLHHEPFDLQAAWRLRPQSRSLMSNQAMPWIIFERDRERFENEYPVWDIKRIQLHTPFRYLLSGGVSMRGLMPDSTYSFWRRLEDAMGPMMKWAAMFSLIVLERKQL